MLFSAAHVKLENVRASRAQQAERRPRLADRDSVWLIARGEL